MTADQVSDRFFVDLPQFEAELSKTCLLLADLDAPFNYDGYFDEQVDYSNEPCEESKDHANLSDSEATKNKKKNKKQRKRDAEKRRRKQQSI